MEGMTYNSQKDVTTTADLIWKSITTDCQKLGECWEKCNHVLAPLLCSGQYQKQDIRTIDHPQ